jgi:hypothetical protein
LEAETEAIVTEGPYFNASRAEINATLANRNAAHRILRERGHLPPRCTNAILDNPALWAAYELEADAYRAAHARLSRRLKETTRPYMTDADRLARYLSARENAHLARTESDAAA